MRARQAFLRAGLVACAALQLGTSSGALAAEPPIATLEVVVHTFDDWGAGTDDNVTLSLGPAYEWVLEQPGAKAFEHGQTSRFRLSPRGLHASDVKELHLRKTRGGDDWYLGGVEVWVDGKPFFRNTEIKRWVTDASPEWEVGDLQSKREH